MRVETGKLDRIWRDADGAGVKRAGEFGGEAWCEVTAIRRRGQQDLVVLRQHGRQLGGPPAGRVAAVLGELAGAQRLELGRRLLDTGADEQRLATGARPQPPYWADGLDRVVDVRDVLEGRAVPSGEVVLIDDLGFHQATSVAELLADRGCQVRLSTSGMVVGQDLGITLDLETFNVRAHAKGISQYTDEVVLGASEADGRIVLQVLKHTTGVTTELPCDWVVCATHSTPEDSLWRELDGAPFPVYRAGDCLTPRRAHAAVIEGHRVGVGL